MLSSRFIFLDLGNCDIEELNGKDLVQTNAPQELLNSISSQIKESKYAGKPAEEVFIETVVSNGYEVNIISSVEDIEVYSASARDY